MDTKNDESAYDGSRDVPENRFSGNRLDQPGRRILWIDTIA